MNKWAVLGTVMLGLFMVVVDFNIVTVALPAMMHDLRVNAERVKLVIETYALSYAVFTLIGAWLRERIGIRNTYESGLVIFIAASVACGLAWDMPSMIVFRIIQGVGGGIMMPTGFTLVSESFPPHERGRAFGLFGTVIVFAPSIAPTLGGWLVESASWRTIFFINIPLGALTFILAYRVMKDTSALRPAPFDLWGFVTLGFSLGATLYALNEVRRLGWGHPLILSALAAAALAFALFILIDTRIRNPIINLTLFRNYNFSMMMILHWFRCFILFGRVVLLPILLQTVLGYRPLVTGLLLMPGAVAAGLTMPAIGHAVDRRGPRAFIFWGFAIQAAACFMYYNIGPHTTVFGIVGPMVLHGIGAGLCATPISAAAMNVAPREHIGLVSIVMTVVMQVASAFGAAVLGALVYAYAAHAGAAHQAANPVLLGYRFVFMVMGALCLVSLLPTLAIWKLGPVEKHAAYVQEQA